MSVAQSFTLKSSPNIDVSQLIRGLTIRNPSQIETLYPKMHWIYQALNYVTFTFCEHRIPETVLFCIYFLHAIYDPLRVNI